MQICSAIHEILANKAFTATNGLISQSFIVAFVYPTYIRIALIWGFSAQLCLWKLVHWLWYVIYKSTCPENYIPAVMPPLNPTSPPFSQHILWQCYNPLGIPSSTAEILLFNSVFYDRVAPVSVSTLKPLLGVIGVLLLKPRASPITSVCI